MTGRALGLIVALAACLGLVAGCGGGGESAGKQVNWYVFDEPSGAFDEAVQRCNEEAGGRYRIAIVPLPTNADQQRELVVRRLAARDKDIDLIGMDVIWTAEFAEAKWLRPWTGEAREEIESNTVEGPLRTAQYEDKLYAMPLTSNTQLLWYRKDRVERAPKTWGEMIDMAEKIGEQGTIQVQGARYEGLVVWFNSMVASAGGQVLNENLEVELGQPAVRAAEVMKRLASSDAADPTLSNAREDNGRLAFQSGDSSFMINWPYVYPSAKAEAPEVFENMGYVPYPSVIEGQPGRAPLGGINLGVSSYSQEPRESFEAALCLRAEESEIAYAAKGGLPPTIEKLYSDPRLKKSYPFADALLTGLRNGVPRPVSPAYSDISLAIQQTIHPPDEIEPKETIQKLRERLATVAEGGLF
jgi:multiple sugar transport system substrate-binding protein